MSWSTPIENLAVWRTHNWMKYEFKSNNLVLRLHCDQVLITSDSKVLESLNMNCKIKGIYKQDALILFVALPGKELRKIKFKIKANVTQCLQKLAEHFSVINYDSDGNGLNMLCIPPKYRNFTEALKGALTLMQSPDDYARIPMPTEYLHFIKLCLLDPAFPLVVKETDKILNKFIQKSF